MPPVLLYGLEICPLNKAELHLRDFAVTRFLMKLFKTSSIAVMKDCCRCFGLKLPSELLEILFKKLCSNVVLTMYIRGYFMTHCALIALLYRFSFTRCLFFNLRVSANACSTDVLVNKDWYTRDDCIVVLCCLWRNEKWKKNIKILEFNWYDTSEIILYPEECVVRL